MCVTSALLGKCTLITVILKEGLSWKFWLGENLGTKIPGKLFHLPKFSEKFGPYTEKKRVWASLCTSQTLFRSMINRISC